MDETVVVLRDEYLLWSQDGLEVTKLKKARFEAACARHALKRIDQRHSQQSYNKQHLTEPHLLDHHTHFNLATKC
jgi:hypothetical protein